MFEKLDEEAKALIFKVIVPAIAGLSVKLAIMIKTEKKYTWFQGITSFLAGLILAYLSHPLVQQYASPNSMSLVTAAIAMSGDKIAHFFIYKFHVEEVFKKFFLDRFTKK